MLIKRYRCHLKDHKNVKSHKANWIRSLLSNNQKPIIECLQDNIENLNEALKLEIEYIDKYKKLGCNLTNGTKGGEINKVFEDDVKEKISETLKRKYKSGEIKVWNEGKHIPNLTKGKPRPSVAGENNSFYGKKHTKESLEKMSKIHKVHYNVDIDEVIRLRLVEKLKQKEIADIYNVNNAYICKILIKNGIRKNKTKKYDKRKKSACYSS